MTARELLGLVSERPLLLAGALAAPAVAALILSLVLGRGSGNGSPWKYVGSALVYATCIPGMLGAVLTGYTLFFTRENLLDHDPLVYLLPIVMMAVTLLLVRRFADFRELPGFDRLWGLMVLIGATFVLLLAISKTRIWVLFGGSIAYLVALATALFALLKWGAHTAFRGSGEPRQEPPSFPRP